MCAVSSAAGRQICVGASREGKQRRDQRKAEEEKQDDAENTSHSGIVASFLSRYVIEMFLLCGFCFWCRPGFRPAPEASGLFGCWFGSRALDDKVVVDTECAGRGVGLHAGDSLVALVVDDAVEGDVTAFYDDVDGVEAARWIVGDAAGHHRDVRARSRSLSDSALVGVVFPQRGLGEDAIVDCRTDAVVVGREREDFDLVVYRLDSGNTLEGVVDVFLENGTRGVALDDDGLAVEAEGDPVEDAKVGEAT